MRSAQRILTPSVLPCKSSHTSPPFTFSTCHGPPSTPSSYSPLLYPLSSASPTSAPPSLFTRLPLTFYPSPPISSAKTSNPPILPSPPLRSISSRSPAPRTSPFTYPTIFSLFYRLHALLFMSAAAPSPPPFPYFASPLILLAPSSPNLSKPSPLPLLSSPPLLAFFVSLFLPVTPALISRSPQTSTEFYSSAVTTGSSSKFSKSSHAFSYWSLVSRASS